LRKISKYPPHLNPLPPEERKKREMGEGQDENLVSSMS